MFPDSIVNIKENLQKVQERIAQAALKSGRSPEEITLVAVSKKQSPEKIRMAADAGASVFGENYVQEAQEKIALLGGPAQSNQDTGFLPCLWHLIGHLQSNKVKIAVPLFTMIHTVDSLDLARVISQRAGMEGKIQQILIQVNVAEEESKSGTSTEEALKLAGAVSELPHISLEGLMTVPPFLDDPDQVRPYFIQLRDLRDHLNRYLPRPLKHLSMGMSHDFEAAIEEGATLVRVGSAIFGPRG